MCIGNLKTLINACDAELCVLLFYSVKGNMSLFKNAPNWYEIKDHLGFYYESILYYIHTL